MLPGPIIYKNHLPSTVRIASPKKTPTSYPAETGLWSAIDNIHRRPRLYMAAMKQLCQQCAFALLLLLFQSCLTSCDTISGSV